MVGHNDQRECSLGERVVGTIEDRSGDYIRVLLPYRNLRPNQLELTLVVKAVVEVRAWGLLLEAILVLPLLPTRILTQQKVLGRSGYLYEMASKVCSSCRPGSSYKACLQKAACNVCSSCKYCNAGRVCSGQLSIASPAQKKTPNRCDCPDEVFCR